jgi:hypothetical protein
MCGSEIVNAWQLLKKKTMLLVHIVCALCLWEKKTRIFTATANQSG